MPPTPGLTPGYGTDAPTPSDSSFGMPSAEARCLMGGLSTPAFLDVRPEVAGGDSKVKLNQFAKQVGGRRLLSSLTWHLLCISHPHSLAPSLQLTPPPSHLSAVAGPLPLLF